MVPVTAGQTTPFLAPPVKSVPGAIARLEQIQEFIEQSEPRGRHDGVACFNHLYTVITRRVLAGIEGGRFADAEYLTALDLAFVNRYLKALRLSVNRIASVPSPWRVLIRRRERQSIAAIQFAVAGVNAHVNYDLPSAVVDTSLVLGGDPDSGTRRSDYLIVNQIFAEEMQGLRQHFMNEMARVLDEKAFSQVLNVIGNWSIVEARDAAWRNAEILWALRRLGVSRSLFIDGLDRAFGLAGHLLLTDVL